MIHAPARPLITLAMVAAAALSACSGGPTQAPTAAPSDVPASQPAGGIPDACPKSAPAPLAADATAKVTLTTEKGYAYANPDSLARDRLEERVAKVSAKFGLTPVDRSQLGAFEVKARSDLQALVDRRTAPA